MTRFRAVWPITNERLPFTALVAQARLEVPFLVAQAHAHLTGPGRYSFALSTETPGSGRITTWCLLYEAPATPAPARTIPHLETVHQEESTAA